MFRQQALISLVVQAAAASAFVAPGPALYHAAASPGGVSRPTTTRLDMATAAADEELLHRSLLAARLEYEGRRSDSATAAAASPEAEHFQYLLRTRRTINEFEPTLPSGWEGALTRAIEAATYAPNHKRTEPWRFHLLGPESVRRVCELNAEIVTEKKGEAAGEKKLQRWLKMPGWLVVTCVRDDDEGESSSSSSSSSSMDDPTGLARENYAAVCCAAQNLCLSLHAEGMGTKWTTGPVNFDPRFGAAAGLPENEFVVGTMWFGAPVKTPDAPPKKLSIDDVLTRHS